MQGVVVDYPALVPDCRKCGAPIAFARPETTTCRFCGTSNDPPPKEAVVPVPVQIVNQVVQVVQQDGSPAPVELRCPLCRKRLVTVEAAEVALSGCGGCGGIWVDNDSAHVLLAAPQRVFIELAVNAGRNAKVRAASNAPRSCPACTAVLDRVTTHGVELDVCPDHGTWFDAFELRTLVEALFARDKVPSKPLPTKVACVECKAEIAPAQANIGENGPTCDPCWRKRQEQLVAQSPSVAHAAGEMLKAAGKAVHATVVGVGGAVFLAVMATATTDDGCAYHHHHHHRSDW